MKQFKILSLVLASVLFSSCEKYFEDSNTNPNSPNEVPVNVLLPTIELSLSYVYWGDGARYLGLFSQHLTGVSRQFVAYNNYSLVGNNVDNMWSGMVYPKVLNNIQELRKIADPETEYTALGIADMLEAYCLLFTTDCFGDLPYSEALKGLEIPQPKFDSQEEIFAVINSRINSAKAQFAKGASTKKPGASDLIYAGDVSKWSAFANALQARVNLRLAKRNGNYQAVVDALADGGIADAAGDAKLPYGSSSTANGPWFQYNDQRNDIAIGIRYKDILTSLGDPRLATYGADLNTSHPILTPDVALPFLTYTEQAFILAEAKFRTGDLDGAYSAYLDGIKASFKDAKMSDADYDAYVARPEIAPGSAGLTLDLIMTQKYIASFTDPEAFADWRRTGIPSLTPNSGSEIPRRLPYPESEVLYNKNCPRPDQVTMFTRVWWDVQ